ncbi:hypothetical protein NDN08_002098 [Rhodosorus marinus]|uniref:Uncharacterized protein n=1 Tax=Rhodosorus marinus TaxID=101924 RepID=A0AAV8UYK0_9RHOD|nr:hypothetical protein NDN08_002098 [Rhodosorus marinus]
MRLVFSILVLPLFAAFVAAQFGPNTCADVDTTIALEFVEGFNRDLVYNGEVVGQVRVRNKERDGENCVRITFLSNDADLVSVRAGIFAEESLIPIPVNYPKRKNKTNYLANRGLAADTEVRKLSIIFCANDIQANELGCCDVPSLSIIAHAIIEGPDSTTIRAEMKPMDPGPDGACVIRQATGPNITVCQMLKSCCVTGLCASGGECLSPEAFGSSTCAETSEGYINTSYNCACCLASENECFDPDDLSRCMSTSDYGDEGGCLDSAVVGSSSVCECCDVQGPNCLFTPTNGPPTICTPHAETCDGPDMAPYTTLPPLYRCACCGLVVACFLPPDIRPPEKNLCAARSFFESEKGCSAGIDSEGFCECCNPPDSCRITDEIGVPRCIAKADYSDCAPTSAVYIAEDGSCACCDSLVSCIDPENSSVCLDQSLVTGCDGNTTVRDDGVCECCTTPNCSTTDASGVKRCKTISEFGTENCPLGSAFLVPETGECACDCLPVEEKCTLEPVNGGGAECVDIAMNDFCGSEGNVFRRPSTGKCDCCPNSECLINGNCHSAGDFVIPGTSCVGVPSESCECSCINPGECRDSSIQRCVNIVDFATANCPSGAEVGPNATECICSCGVDECVDPVTGLCKLAQTYSTENACVFGAFRLPETGECTCDCLPLEEQCALDPGNGGVAECVGLGMTDFCGSEGNVFRRPSTGKCDCCPNSECLINGNCHSAGDFVIPGTSCVGVPSESCECSCINPGECRDSSIQRCVNIVDFATANCPSGAEVGPNATECICS